MKDNKAAAAILENMQAEIQQVVIEIEAIPQWHDLEFFNTDHNYILTSIPTWPKIVDYLDEQKAAGVEVLPARKNMFNAFKLTPRDTVKVVILGQDPYPNKEHAMGLAFSVPNGVYPLPPTLKNIFKELYDDVNIIKTDSLGSLREWAKQGVLLLNTALTVVEGKSGSHDNIGWGELAQEVLETVSEDKTGMVFILWGSKAQAFKQYIKNQESHMILCSVHPSPLSAHKGFFGSKPFSKTNFFLESVGKTPIDWK